MSYLALSYRNEKKDKIDIYVHERVSFNRNSPIIYIIDVGMAPFRKRTSISLRQELLDDQGYRQLNDDPEKKSQYKLDFFCRYWVFVGST